MAKLIKSKLFLKTKHVSIGVLKVATKCHIYYLASVTTVAQQSFWYT